MGKFVMWKAFCGAPEIFSELQPAEAHVPANMLDISSCLKEERWIMDVHCW